MKPGPRFPKRGPFSMESNMDDPMNTQDLTQLTATQARGLIWNSGFLMWMR